MATQNTRRAIADYHSNLYEPEGYMKQEVCELRNFLHL